jgi:hypothetical protein
MIHVADLQENCRQRALPRIRDAILLTLIVCVIGFATYVAVLIFQIHRHGAVAERMLTQIVRLAESKPQEVSDDYWAFCIAWTWQMHCNCGMLSSQIPTDELAEIERELREAIDRGAELATVDWIWDRYVDASLTSTARRYDRYRPTSHANREQFETNGRGCDPLSAWRGMYRQRINDD